MREGCLVLYLVKGGLVMEDVTLISIAARVWFIVGEMFIFATALMLKTITANETE